MNKTASHPAEAELTKKIGQRLRSARQAQGLSLSELSSLTGALSKSRISNYEQGIRRMGLYLLCLEDTDPLTREERVLVACYRRADSRGRETILKVAEAQSGYPSEGSVR